MAIDEPATPGSYSTLFRQYVLRGAEQTLNRVTDETPLDIVGREQALLTLSYAMDLPEAWPITRDLMVALAPQLELAGYREEWIPFLEQGIVKSQAAGDHTSEGELLHQLAVIQHLLGQLDDAHHLYAQSAACFARAGNPSRQGRAINRQAFMFRQQRRLPEANAAAEAALRLLPPDDPERGYTAFVWGCIAMDNRDWPVAVQHYQAALRISEQSGDQRQIAWSLTNLGPALRWSNRNEEAIACFERAITIMDEINDRVHLAAARANLGNIYLNTNRFEAALALYREAEQVFREVHDQLRVALISTNLSLVHRQLGQPDRAAHYAEASIHLHRQIGDDAGVVNAMNCLAEACLDAGRDDEAEAVLDEARALWQRIQDRPGAGILLADLRANLDEVARRKALR